jgi:multisubunit Na+/H+ antiporter MnhG subunit
MNRWAFYSGLGFTFIVVVYKCFVLYTGMYFSNWGFKFANLAAVLIYTIWIPITLVIINRAHYRWHMPGREVFKAGLGIVAISLIGISIYHVFEVQSDEFKQQANRYYNSPEYLKLLKQQQALHPHLFKIQDIPKIIASQTNGISVFRAVTGRMIPFLLYGGLVSLFTAIGLRVFRSLKFKSS